MNRFAATFFYFFGFVVFADGADVTDSPADLQLGNLHWAIGAGIRPIYLPIGPITLATSSQPCCQCYGATVWAGIDRLLVEPDDAMGQALDVGVRVLGEPTASRNASRMASLVRASSAAI